MGFDLHYGFLISFLFLDFRSMLSNLLRRIRKWLRILPMGCLLQQLDNVFESIMQRAQGIYGQVGEKIGKWVELYDNYYDLNQVIQIGIYEKGKGSKEWKILIKESYSKRMINMQLKYLNKQLVEEEHMIQKVRKLDSGLSLIIIFMSNRDIYLHRDCQIIMTGDYQLGQRIGNWEIYLRRYQYDQYKSMYPNIQLCALQRRRKLQLIGCQNWKMGRVRNNHQLIYSGIYENRNKHGRWDIKYRKQQEEFTIIGGGYFENNEKIGMWVEPIQYFNQNKQILFEGCYKKNKKHGWWNMYCKKSYENELIGGGNYEDKYGTKNGVWNEIEEISYFPKEFSAIMRQYLNGMKLYPITKQFMI
ncbi:unnamed protein product (macronuclear) [Paramecium tetraurelia]|uniref:Uncharacterized protein n=1 Tax=Paramecium tetraurelia TaxID=5888 RepID=A0C267_PARTE|nr:uncharacterized protein GSPATT00034361001 [Paramecium tetraurelia]CAK64884.1 unnamed protein product [Paramecium tetraurelia]|eukprot:XP_001432281.1 hypothetical protein (macronuclear) [Paramecium tetraurelia strain d4-2]